eukprot:jgi/Psemu1/240496/estExt_Genewise1.C_1840001
MGISHTIHGWDRLKPSHGGSAHGEFDSFATGKSCRWVPATRLHYFPKKILSLILFASRASFLGTWVCRDCGEHRSPLLPWESCPLLRPRGKCPDFDYQGWEEPRPRSASNYDPFSSSPFPVRLITSYGVGKVRRVEYEQPQCHLLAKPCFDMDRCTAAAHHTAPGINGTNANTDTDKNDRRLIQPLPVFAYPGRSRVDLDGIVGGKDGSAIGIRIVEDPGTACLLISHAKNLRTAKESSSWNYGVNHYVYGVTKPITETVHYDMASLGSVVLTEAQIRPGYDVPLPLDAIWKNAVSDHAEQAHEYGPRKYLLSFKGSIQDTLQPYYQHRWLAAEYLHDEPDVVIDVQCKHKTLWGDTVTFAPYDNPSQANFDDLMVNSTFAFCPGGSHVTSFRFTEILSAGAIPVLLPEIVTPFYPELDWSGCVIRVSQARIVDLPRRLRAIPPEEVRERQVQCRRLYRRFLDVANPGERKTESETSADEDENTAQQQQQQPFPTAGYLAAALRIWRVRLEKQNYANKIENDLVHRSL